ncbi:hypothetical protein [Pseudomonas fluorescens]|uniref:hypothetical protein n=1 Tax=Pseudomonas fluorescens TaxID=294 RepID=UPI001CD2112D|nr:hypothetical protein [Pseudomonas fluorescens]
MQGFVGFRHRLEIPGTDGLQVRRIGPADAHQVVIRPVQGGQAGHCALPLLLLASVSVTGAVLHIDNRSA